MNANLSISQSPNLKIASCELRSSLPPATCNLPLATCDFHSLLCTFAWTSNLKINTAIGRLRDWGMILFVAGLLLAACAPAYADPASIASSVEPAAIYAKLGEVASFDDAATQFAAAINVDPSLVRIRIQPGNCTVCRFESTPQLSKAEGLTSQEASKLAEEKDKVSFFVPKFSCTFLFDQNKLLPQTCQLSPV